MMREDILHASKILLFSGVGLKSTYDSRENYLIYVSRGNIKLKS